MRKLVLAAMIVSVCAGCQTGTQVKSASQAMERATYLGSYAAGLQKQVQETELTIELLRAQLDDQRQDLRLYQERADAAKRRLAELGDQKGATEAERSALEWMKEAARSERSGMLGMVANQEIMIMRIKGHIRLQESCRAEMLEKTRSARRESKALGSKATRLAE